MSELKLLWEPVAQGKITKWNQIRSEWPDKVIKLFGAGPVFRHLRLLHRGHRRENQVQPGDYTGSEDDNVLVQGIEGDRFALGYLPYAYYAPHVDRMKAVGVEWDVDSRSGKPAVKPSMEALVSGTYLEEYARKNWVIAIIEVNIANLGRRALDHLRPNGTRALRLRARLRPEHHRGRPGAGLSRIADHHRGDARISGSSTARTKW